MLGQEQAATIAFLSRAESFGLTGKVEHIETHGAIVFMVGDRAYKLKRAVTLPYFDYGTVALRKQSCEAELRLNQRTAAEIYLEVRPVCRSKAGALNLKNEGEPVDWLVVMRRFEQEGLFDQLATTKQLTPELMRTLTDTIVTFHTSAELTPDHGGSAAMRRIIDGNRKSMGLFPEIIPPDIAASLYGHTLSAFDEIAASLDARRAAGKVRRCHGDLHLGNICMFKGEPTLFDCVEFSDDIACIDVLYDIAFLVMDLWHRNLKHEANLVFNRYLDMMGEADGMAAIPLFLSIRAAIRAHVWAASSKAQVTSDARMRYEALARHNLACAMRMLAKRRPRLIAVGGLSGTGKSTLAYGLAPEVGVAPGARVLRSDVLRKRRMAAAPETRLPESAYTSAEHEAVYRDLAHTAAATLDTGYAAIVDAVFAGPGERADIAVVAATAGVPFTGLWLEASKGKLSSRLRKRKNDASDATVEVLKRQLGYEIGALGAWHSIDADGDAADTLAKASSAMT
jgi:uncharacterized protein